ncbi:type VII secretion protein EccB [Mycobacterium sp.]|uniref:type VII secretion protein EccB n=1 Tax=Mycobacterium sp. TaxID=1785 RepID=UPI0025F07E13|nr:type VII secretion protein EccB [Mycobacterium sp.]MBW0012918.1 type VII secretion protein EccB [Mycobacterium sp.]
MQRSPRQPTAARLQVSGYRFLLRRVECALLTGDAGAVGQPLRAATAALMVGCLVAAVAAAGCAVLALLRPQAELDRARIAVGRDSGALYVRVDDVWHPVLNLASARLVAATPANPQRVPESLLARSRRGPLLGIPGAPQLIGRPLSENESAWTICDSDGAVPSVVVIGAIEGSPVGRLPAGQAVLVAPASGSPVYLLYNGQRAMVDLADAAVVRALRLEGRAPRLVSHWLLNALPETPPISAPRIRGTGADAPGLPGFAVGNVLRVTRGDGDEYYVVLVGGVQRIGQLAADLLRFSSSLGAANAIAVAPDAIRAAGVVRDLPVAGFPDRAPVMSDGGKTLCVTWQPGRPGDSGIALLAGDGLPVQAGQLPVTLAQADGGGAALDAVYVPPGRSAYVFGGGRAGTRFLVTETGVRFAVHDEDAAHDLGLPAPIPAHWPVLSALPSGPELSRVSASVARDTVAGGP